jgi:hypothetical protein
MEMEMSGLLEGEEMFPELGKKRRFTAYKVAGFEMNLITAKTRLYETDFSIRRPKSASAADQPLPGDKLRPSPQG